MIWFTSDLHLGHDAIIRMCNRPFGSIDEMNDTLVRNFNECVKKNDTIYFLGDISYKLKVEEANEMISKLNGKKYLCVGNHDKKYDGKLFEDIADCMRVNFNGIHLTLMHYPMLEWYKSRQGAIHLHGHQHNKAEYNLQQRELGIRRYDVGVDANNYHPVSMKEIIKFYSLSTK